MKRLELYVPKLEDYWYEEKLQSDPETMNYNAGYDVSYYGYHYDTGCIDFPKERWALTYDKRLNENRYFAYLKDIQNNEFVGYVNYHYNKNDDRYECGIVIEASKRGVGYSTEGLMLLCDEAKSAGVKALYDNFEKDRANIKSFLNVGFQVVEEVTWKKFGEDVVGIIVKKEL